MKKWGLSIAAVLVVVVVIAVAFLAMGLGDDDPEAPGVPLNVVLTAGEGEAAISWDAPTESGSSDVVGYTVYLFATADAEHSEGSRATEDEHLIWAGLDGETRYFFAVSASNDDEEGPMSVPLPVTTLRIIVVPIASDMVLDAEEIGSEYDMDTNDTTRPADLIALGLRNYFMVEYSVPTGDISTVWRFVSIEIGVCGNPGEAESMFRSMFENNSIALDLTEYDDIELGNESKYYKYPQPIADGLLLDGWFRSGSVVVHMEFDTSDYEISVTENWFEDLMEEQLAKVLANSNLSAI
ncbi:MAG: fibronectin type III domain-containing protein [Euryarchaeota archaeon]|nr:fibronectin type III domain-containing protein [Euryarchaeota archaeon]